MSDWKFYIIENKGCTYAGVSPDPVRRLRQHNGEIKGGAKYTTGKGCGWEHICLISGFKDKIQAMQFEWAVKHVAPRNAGGLQMRIKKLYSVLKSMRWTSKSPLASEVPLIVEWKSNHVNIQNENCNIPTYITEHYHEEN